MRANPNKYIIIMVTQLKFALCINDWNNLNDTDSTRISCILLDLHAYLNEYSYIIVVNERITY